MGFFVANEHQSLDEELRSEHSPDPAASARSRTPLKKSRLEFFSATRFRAGVFAAQPVEPHWEIEPTPTKTASGLSSWLSRDPIGEVGFRNGVARQYGWRNTTMEKNRYIYAANDGIDKLDDKGLAVIVPIVIETVVSCASSTFLQYAADAAAKALGKIVLCEVIKRNCVSGDIPKTESGAAHIPVDLAVGAMPSNLFKDFGKCIGSVGTAPPSFTVTHANILSYRCLGSKVLYILWGRVHIQSADESIMPSATTLQEVHRNWCGKSTNCQCCE